MKPHTSNGTGRHGNGSVLDELSDYDAAFDQSFSIVAYAMNRFIVDHMLRVTRRITNDDFEAMVILGVLSHQNAAHLLPPGSMPSDTLDERGRAPEGRNALRPLRLRDITQITQLPRETVRRKLAKLEVLELAERNSDGWVVSRARIDPEMREFARESVKRFLRTTDDMMRALRDGDRRAGEGQRGQPSSLTRPLTGGDG